MKTICTFLFILALTRLPAAADDLTATVAKVVDGDTIHVKMNPSGAYEKVRIIGVDTPELHYPKKPVQKYAKEAKYFFKAVFGADHNGR